MAHPLIPELEQLAQATLAGGAFELRGLQLLTHRIPLTLQVLVQRRVDSLRPAARGAGRRACSRCGNRRDARRGR